MTKSIEEWGLSAKSYKNIDGLVTQEPCLMLVTYYADCVPYTSMIGR